MTLSDIVAAVRWAEDAGRVVERLLFPDRRTILVVVRGSIPMLRAKLLLQQTKPDPQP